MPEDAIAYLMEDSRRDCGYARWFLSEGVYPKSISNSYYAAFYAAKALLLKLNIRAGSHKSVHAAIETAIDQGSLSIDWRHLLEVLHSRRNQAVYRYARRDWTLQEAEEALTMAEGFVEEVESILAGR